MVSGPSPFGEGCDGSTTGTVVRNLEIGPQVAVDPRRPGHMVAAWRQDRRLGVSTIGAVTAVSTDAGRTWRSGEPPTFSRCADGDPTNGGDYAQADLPTVSISPDGTAYAAALRVDRGGTGVDRGVLVARSADGGLRWDTPVTLIRDQVTGPNRGFSDRSAVTADPTDSRYAYVVWQQSAPDPDGVQRIPTWFARTTDGGHTWERPRPIYDPGPGRQTYANRIAVLPDGTLVNLLSEVAVRPDATSAEVKVMRSTDHGATWSAPILAGDIRFGQITDPFDGTTTTGIPVEADIAVDPRSGRANVYLTWRDTRFTPDGAASIVLAASHDGGQTWSAPRRVSAEESRQAFAPAVAVNAAGTVEVTYQDFTFDDPAEPPLLTDVWLVRSPDGGASLQRRERLTAASFDIRTLPADSRQPLPVPEPAAVSAVGGTFATVFSFTTGDPRNPTDVVSRRASARSGPAWP